jgi:type VI protein secretion system component Hcp
MAGDCDNFMWVPQDATLKLEGETTDTYFQKLNAFEVLDFDFKIRNADPLEVADSSSVPSVGKAKFDVLRISKEVDRASSRLYEYCSQGIMIPNLMLAIRKASGDGLLYLQYIFRCNYITEINWKNGKGEGADEDVLIAFKAMGFQYIQQTMQGSQQEGPRVWYWSTVVHGDVKEAPGLAPKPGGAPSRPLPPIPKGQPNLKVPGVKGMDVPAPAFLPGHPPVKR